MATLRVRPPGRGGRGSTTCWPRRSSSRRWSWSYAPSFRCLVDQWNRDPNYSYGFFVIPIAAGDLLEPPRAARPRAAGAAAGGGSCRCWPCVALRFLLYERNEQYIETATIPLVVAGLALALGGWHLLAGRLAGDRLPVLHAAAAAEHQHAAWPSRSSGWRRSAASALLQMLGLPVLAEGNVIIVGADAAGGGAGLQRPVDAPELRHADHGDGDPGPPAALGAGRPAGQRRPDRAGQQHPPDRGDGVVLPPVRPARPARRSRHDAAGWAMMPIALVLVCLELRVLSWLFVEVEEVDARLRSGGRGPAPARHAEAARTPGRLEDRLPQPDRGPRRRGDVPARRAGVVPGRPARMAARGDPGRRRPAAARRSRTWACLATCCRCPGRVARLGRRRPGRSGGAACGRRRPGGAGPGRRAGDGRVPGAAPPAGSAPRPPTWLQTNGMKAHVLGAWAAPRGRAGRLAPARLPRVAPGDGPAAAVVGPARGSASWPSRGRSPPTPRGSSGRGSRSQRSTTPWTSIGSRRARATAPGSTTRRACPPAPPGRSGSAWSRRSRAGRGTRSSSTPSRGSRPTGRAGSTSSAGRSTARRGRRFDWTSCGRSAEALGLDGRVGFTGHQADPAGALPGARRRGPRQHPPRAVRPGDRRGDGLRPRGRRGPGRRRGRAVRGRRRALGCPPRDPDALALDPRPPDRRSRAPPPARRRGAGDRAGPLRPQAAGRTRGRRSISANRSPQWDSKRRTKTPAIQEQVPRFLVNSSWSPLVCHGG